MDLEARVITPDRYWTVYQGKKYLGAISYRDGAYRAARNAVIIGESETFEGAAEMLRPAQ